MPDHDYTHVRSRRFLRSEAGTYPSFRIPASRITDSSSAGTDRFVREKTYFEMLLAQMHLRYRREYWREFVPIASFLTELVYDGQRRTVPFIVGPQLLEKAGIAADPDAPLDLYNRRVAGPYPFVGDDVIVFAGLYRTVTHDWARQALSLVEGVAKGLDVTKLSSIVNIAEPLVTSLENLFGMQQLELRLGEERSLVDSEGDGGNVLSPGFTVILGPDSQETAQPEQFWVRDDKLYHGTDAGNLTEYRGADFILLRTVSLDSREDYTTFDFHRRSWRRVEELLWNGEVDAARRAMFGLRADLMLCPDLTVDDRVKLFAMYRSKFDTARAAVEVPESGYRLSSGDIAEMSEEDLRYAVRSAAPIPPSYLAEARELLPGA